MLELAGITQSRLGCDIADQSQRIAKRDSERDSLSQTILYRLDVIAKGPWIRLKALQLFRDST